MNENDQVEGISQDVELQEEPAILNILGVIVEEDKKSCFDQDLVKKYPRSNRRLYVDVSQYGIQWEAESRPSGTTTHISPHGIEFRSSEDFAEGALLKIQVSIPNYWQRKQQLVEYTRVDTPERFNMLAKVVSTESIGKRGKKKMVLCRTVNLDDVDEKVLKSFLKDG